MFLFHEPLSFCLFVLLGSLRSAKKGKQRSGGGRTALRKVAGTWAAITRVARRTTQRLDFFANSITYEISDRFLTEQAGQSRFHDWLRTWALVLKDSPRLALMARSPPWSLKEAEIKRT